MAQRSIDISTREYDGFRFIFQNNGLDISDGTSVLIEGQAGVGKTVFALQLACSYLAQLSVQARSEQRPIKEYIWYVSLEQDGRSLENLLKRFGRFGLPAQDVKVCVCPSDDHHAFTPGHLHIHARVPEIDLDHFINDMVRRTGDKRCALLIVDSIGYYETANRDKSPRQQIDRLCREARKSDFGLLMVREKEPLAAEQVTEYVTDTVLELQFRPINHQLPYGPRVRTLEVKKSRIQKSHRGPHEFDVDDKLGVVVYPSSDSLFEGRKAEEKGREALLDVFDGGGCKHLNEQLKRSDQPGKSGLRPGECLLLYGKPGNLKTVLGFHFLKIGTAKSQPTLFISFKIDQQALAGTAKAYLKPAALDDWNNRNHFLDVRQTFLTPARVLAQIRSSVEERAGRLGKIQRAVVFGLGMIDKLPAFQGQELTFLQVLVSYFESRGVSALFIDWPPTEGEVEHKLALGAIVNYFSTAIEQLTPERPRAGRPTRVRLQVTRHEFRVIREPVTLEIQEGRRARQSVLTIKPVVTRKRVSGTRPSRGE